MTYSHFIENRLETVKLAHKEEKYLESVKKENIHQLLNEIEEIFIELNNGVFHNLNKASSLKFRALKYMYVVYGLEYDTYSMDHIFSSMRNHLAIIESKKKLEKVLLLGLENKQKRNKI